VFNSADAGALNILTRQYSVRYLLIDRVNGAADPAVLLLGRVVYSNRDAAIVAVLSDVPSAAAALRGDPAWSPSLVDGPRILGVEKLDRAGATVRLQVRTAPNRQDEVSRELRRRIQIEFQRQGVPLSVIQRMELLTPLPKAPAAPDAEHPISSGRGDST
jgi:small-conductance mechanosensitive channel